MHDRGKYNKPNMSRLVGKTAVITGASSGIGRAIAVTFAREGARVVINYNRSREKAEALVEEIESMGLEARAVQGDVASPADVEKFLAEAREYLLGIDIWVNNAGADILTGEGAVLEDEAKLEKLINVDLKGTMNCCRVVAPLMKKQRRGVIINMSWDLSVHGFHGQNPQMFAAIKAGVMGFSKSLAKSYAPEVRINVLAPGWIETEFASNAMTEEYYKERLREIPLARFGKPEDVAYAALFLASDGSSYITGQVININGGLV